MIIVPWLIFRSQEIMNAKIIREGTRDSIKNRAQIIEQ